MARRTKTGRNRGFTLAGLLVIMTIMMIVVAYTVPRQWSTIVRRDRELQTIFIMKQYAKAIDAFQAKNKIFPVSMSQLKDARQPRFLRGKGDLIDPLTGQADWFVVPQLAVGNTPTGPTVPGLPGSTGTAPPGIPMKDYAGGPFVGIRPSKKGDSLVDLNGKSKYEEWLYTAIDYQRDRTGRLVAAARVWQ